MSHHEHPKFEIPTDPHAKHRYESAMKHVEHAKQAGKSSEEIHEIFHKIMNSSPKDIDSIPTDEAHRKYREAAIEARQAKSSEEAHAIFKKAKG